MDAPIGSLNRAARGRAIRSEVEIEKRDVVPVIGVMGAAEITVGCGVAARVGWAFWEDGLALDEASGRTVAVFRHGDGQASPCLDAADVTVDVLGGSAAHA